MGRRRDFCQGGGQTPDYHTPKDKNLMSGGAERSLRSPPQIPGPQSRFVGGICKGDLKLTLPPLDNYHRCPGRPDPGVGA